MQPALLIDGVGKTRQMTVNTDVDVVSVPVSIRATPASLTSEGKIADFTKTKEVRQGMPVYRWTRCR